MNQTPLFRDTQAAPVPSRWNEADFLAGVKALTYETVSANASGPLREMASHHFASGGKWLRSRMAFGLARDLSLDEDLLRGGAVGWVAALEMLHNGTLVHDDLQDGDEVRRGSVTVWRQFGAEQAINLGDYLMLLAPTAFVQMDLPANVRVKLTQIFCKTSAQIVTGQSLEPQLKRMGDSLEQEYLRCISLKTSALFAGLGRGVALLSGMHEEEQEMISDLMTRIGNIFQIQDDIVDLFGEKGRGRAGCDIKEGKISFLVSKHWLHCPADRDRMREILSQPREQTTDSDVTWLKERFETGGTRAMCLFELNRLIREAGQHEMTQRRPALAAFVENALARVMEPIQHLQKAR